MQKQPELIKHNLNLPITNWPTFLQYTNHPKVRDYFILHDFYFYLQRELPRLVKRKRQYRRLFAFDVQYLNRCSRMRGEYYADPVLVWHTDIADLAENNIAHIYFYISMTFEFHSMRDLHMTFYNIFTTYYPQSINVIFNCLCRRFPKEISNIIISYDVTPLPKTIISSLLILKFFFDRNRGTISEIRFKDSGQDVEWGDISISLYWLWVMLSLPKNERKNRIGKWKWKSIGIFGYFPINNIDTKALECSELFNKK